MRYSPTILLGLLSHVLQASASPSGTADTPAADNSTGVPQLKSETFDTFVQDSKLAMVKFFAPWCGHCVKMAEPYKKASELLKEQAVSAAVAEVDCTLEKELCEKHGVTGYPSIKVFRATNKDAALDYKGARDTESIVEYLKRLSLPAVTVLKAEDVKKHVEGFKSSLVVVAHLPKGHAALAAFEKAADALREEFSFVHVEGKEGTLTVFKSFDEGESKYAGALEKLTEKELSAWLQDEAIPLMDEISPNNYEKYINAKKPMAYLFYDTDEQRKTYGEIVQKVMKPLKGKINAIYISVKDFGEHAKNLNLESHWPGFVIHDVSENLKFPFTGKDKEFTVEALEAFVTKYVAGSLEPHYKSEPIPTDNSAAVKTVVYDNFQSLVLDTNKDVFVEVYAPWCGACKRMAPDFEKLAEAYAPHADKIVIAKMDGIANDLPKSAKFTLEHFPSLLLYKAGSNELVEMKQLGGLKELNDFIQANAANKVTVDLAKFADAPAAAEEDAAASSAGEHVSHDEDHDEL